MSIYILSLVITCVSWLHLIECQRCNVTRGQGTASSCAKRDQSMRVHLHCSPTQVIRIQIACYAFTNCAHRECCINAMNDCREQITHQEQLTQLSACDGLVECNVELYQRTSNYCRNSTTNNDYFVVVHECLTPLTSTLSTTLTPSLTPSTPSTLPVISASTTTNTSNGSSTWSHVHATNTPQVGQLFHNKKDVITGAIGIVLVLIIIVLLIVLCKRKHDRDAAAKTDQHKVSFTNYYASVEPPSPAGSVFPSTPVYATADEIPSLNARNLASVYLPMQGSKQKPTDDGSAYVLEEPRAVYRTVDKPAVPSAAHSPALPLQRLSSATDQPQILPFKTATLPAGYDVTDGGYQSERVNRRRQRPASEQLLDTIIDTYEEIPADFLSLRPHQHSSRLKHRPQPPTPATARPAIVPRTRGGRRKNSSSHDDSAVWYSCSDVDALADSNTGAPVNTLVDRMRRKSSYEDGDVILIDSTIYG